MENRKKLLSVRDLEVKFRVRGRILTAIRGISLDIYENESIAIVGESGSGKSVFTKTFAGMLDSNGFIDNGSIIFDDDELSQVELPLDDTTRKAIDAIAAKLNDVGKVENGAGIWKQMRALEAERKARATLSPEEEEKAEAEISELVYQRTELFNEKQTLDPRSDKAKITEKARQIKALDARVLQKKQELKDRMHANAAALKSDTAYQAEYSARMASLQTEYKAAVQKAVPEDKQKRNRLIAEEILLTASRYPKNKRNNLTNKLVKVVAEAMKTGEDMDSAEVRSEVFGKVAFRAAVEERSANAIKGRCVLNLAQMRQPKEWLSIRGCRIATVFQDPMTSLNPIITIGKQITSIILKHQQCSEVEARSRALEIMKKVGIPNAEKRFDDYPFEYSGGMRQRIVIAIALSCQPKILICDEPTTALDVTIQAQILKLLKQLQREFHYTIVFITHDLGVVANIAERVAVLYAGQIVELGTVEDVFYDPRHPYTWALLSSLPQLAQRNTELFSIQGTPPSLYNKIVGDPFAPRNPYCMKIDTLKEPPMFQVSETHFAKTWLLDPHAPKTEKPEIIQNIHQKLIDAFNI